MSIGADSISNDGDPAIATGGNGVGKLMSSNTTVGAHLSDLGATESDGIDTLCSSEL